MKSLPNSETVPLYQKVKNEILSRIDNGSLQTDDKVPSENDLVRDFGISRMTANRALRELTNEGFLVRISGVGRFVANQRSRGHLLEIKNIAEEIRERNHRHEAQILKTGTLKADRDTALWMELREGTEVFYSLILHLEDRHPIQLEERFVNPAVAPGYGQLDLQQKSPHEYLMEVAPLQEAEHLVQARMPNQQVKNVLKMDDGEPCLVLFRRTWSSGKAVTGVRLYHPGSRYLLGDRFRPQSLFHHHRPKNQ